MQYIQYASPCVGHLHQACQVSWYRVCTFLSDVVSIRNNITSISEDFELFVCFDSGLPVWSGSTTVLVLDPWKSDETIDSEVPVCFEIILRCISSSSERNMNDRNNKSS